MTNRAPLRAAHTLLPASHSRQSGARSPTRPALEDQPRDDNNDAGAPENAQQTADQQSGHHHHCVAIHRDTDNDGILAELRSISTVPVSEY
jgi:hypothetical protein